MYVRMYVCTYVRMYVCTYVCMYVRMYVYVCTYVCMYVRMYVRFGFQKYPPHKSQKIELVIKYWTFFVRNLTPSETSRFCRFERDIHTCSGASNIHTYSLFARRIDIDRRHLVRSTPYRGPQPYMYIGNPRRLNRLEIDKPTRWTL